MEQNFEVITYIDLGLSNITIPSYSATWIMPLTIVERSLNS